MFTFGLTKTQDRNHYSNKEIKGIGITTRGVTGGGRERVRIRILCPNHIHLPIQLHQPLLLQLVLAATKIEVIEMSK